MFKGAINNRPRMACLHHSLLILTLVVGHLAAKAQSAQLFMLSVDNDLFAGQGQDGAYTSGVRFDFLLEDQKSLNGPVVINNFGLQHIMITPNDISNVKQEPGDYPYAGLLSITYSRGIVDPRRKRSITAESVVGILGPYSFAGEVQTELHKLTGSSLPQGWKNQYGTGVLANVNCSVELGVPRMPKGLEVVMQSKLFLGTILTGASLQGMVKFGKMPNHFKSVACRYTCGHSRIFQWYGFVSQQMQGIASNTVLTDRRCRISEESSDRRIISRRVIHSSYGVNFSYLNWGLVLAYKTHSGLIEGQPVKAYGSISISFSP